jgi:hypothetical protein
MSHMVRIAVPGRAASFREALQPTTLFALCGQPATDRPGATRPRLAAHWRVDHDGRLVCIWTVERTPASRDPPD